VHGDSRHAAVAALTPVTHQTAATTQSTTHLQKRQLWLHHHSEAALCLDSLPRASGSGCSRHDGSRTRRARYGWQLHKRLEPAGASAGGLRWCVRGGGGGGALSPLPRHERGHTSDRAGGVLHHSSAESATHADNSSTSARYLHACDGHAPGAGGGVAQHHARGLTARRQHERHKLLLLLLLALRTAAAAVAAVWRLRLRLRLLGLSCRCRPNGLHLQLQAVKLQRCCTGVEQQHLHAPLLATHPLWQRRLCGSCCAGTRSLHSVGVENEGP
jgi:hypothetical protein